jgi:hypothetical protein
VRFTFGKKAHVRWPFNRLDRWIERQIYSFLANSWKKKGSSPTSSDFAASKPDNAGGGKRSYFLHPFEGDKKGRLAMSLKTPDKIRIAQRKLYQSYAPFPEPTPPIFDSTEAFFVDKQTCFLLHFFGQRLRSYV